MDITDNNLKIEELIKEENLQRLRKELNSLPIPQASEILAEIEKEKRVLFFRLLNRDTAADVFAYLSNEWQDQLIQELSDKETSTLLSNLSPDDRTAFLEELPASVTKKMLNLLSGRDRQEARTLLGYPDESVGRLMTTDFIQVGKHWRGGDVLDYIREHGRDSETIDMIYVVDSNGILLGDIRLRRLLLFSPETEVLELYDKWSVKLSPFDDREEAVRVMKRYDVSVLPVVDSEGVMLGIVTFDDVMDVAEEETTEDMHKAASVSPLEMDYRSTKAVSLYSKRVVWLIILVFLNLVSAGVISIFEETLSSTIILASFIPLLVGTGGNTGSQASAIIIRALVTGDIKSAQILPTIGKELLVSAFLGVTLGALAWILGYVRGADDINIALTISLAMVSVIVLGNMIGIMLPFLLVKLKIDPTVASGPLITTLVDALGLLIYFLIATAVLM